MSLFFDCHLSLGPALRRAIAILQMEGMAMLTCKVLDGTIYRRAVLIERSLECPVTEIATRGGIVVELLKQSHVDAYLECRRDADPLRIRQRIAEGHSCFAARQDNRFIGTLWAATDPQRLLPLAWTPPLRAGRYTFTMSSSRPRRVEARWLRS
jgi:hypothetical protein